MKTKIYMVRHGFSVANNDKRFTGQSDIPLNEVGERQAALTGAYFENRSLDALYASDLLRTCQTAEPIAKASGLPIQKEKGLREIFAGQWEGRLFADLERDYPVDYKIWREDVGRARCTGGESVQELADRVLKTVARLAEAHPGETICLVTHATPIRVLCTATSGLPMEEMAAVPWVSNASVNEFYYEQGEFSRGEIDQTDHLGELQTKLPQNV